MSDFASVQVTSEAQAKALMDFAQATREAQQAEEKAKPQVMNVNVARPAGVELKNGGVTPTSAGAQSVTLRNEVIPAGFVRLSNGTVTPLKAAEAAGLTHMIVESSREDRTPLPSFNAGSPQARAEAPQSTQGQKDVAPAEQATLTTNSEDAAAIQKATDALNEATTAHGQVAVHALQEQAVLSGELPTELPQGVSQEAVDAIVGGYVAQGNAVIKDTGMTIGGMTEMLNESELREARLAVFRGKDSALRELAGRAKDRLMNLPNDPALLKELTADWPASCRVENKQGTYVIVTPQGTRTWAEAVTTGMVHF